MNLIAEYVFITYVMFTILTAFFIGIILFMFALKDKINKAKEDISDKIEEANRLFKEINDKI